jgi:hypothetical protein
MTWAKEKGYAHQIEVLTLLIMDFYRMDEAAHENAQRHRQLSCHGMSEQQSKIQNRTK